ncbi:UvrD-helicase domain-containing protein [Arsenophonus nasoniae]|uniref:DNA 3'-5' helicase II n=1 Tax=Arsenophonus nasoniae TaxID=638 RepID=A0AA95GGG3_9GAMM|nr:UvrD-helicase domain-containing protein [Arsenophonus nasoniae]WGL95873.1 UvrD-helicase domain-containing protein [Arsenophonus nasoniae]
MSVEAVLDAQLGLIIAPAGCGKTHLITNVLANPSTKPYLVLTHTTAGVTALKQRLRRLSVSTSNYVIATIDGWASKIANFFPISCPIQSKPDQAKVFYPELRRATLDLLCSGQINEIITASYSRLLVDEYQDCNLTQHKIIKALSDCIPTVVFGDPMQCIFDFSEQMPHWINDVEGYFPLLTSLNMPWRWINAGTHELGEWILASRELLLNNQPINLNTCPRYVSCFNKNDFQNQQKTLYRINNNYREESILVIGDPKNPESRHRFAKFSKILDVVEPVELSDVIKAATLFDNTEGLTLVEHLLTSSASMMTNVEKERIIQRLRSIQKGKNRNPPTQIEKLLLSLAQKKSREKILHVLQHLENKTGTRVYREVVFEALKDSISLAISVPKQSMLESASKIREQRRQRGDKRIPKLAIGSTLLLKGLESDHVLILDANKMNSRNLYVALSRGAKSITVFKAS